MALHFIQAWKSNNRLWWNWFFHDFDNNPLNNRVGGKFTPLFKYDEYTQLFKELLCWNQRLNHANCIPKCTCRHNIFLFPVENKFLPLMSFICLGSKLGNICCREDTSCYFFLFFSFVFSLRKSKHLNNKQIFVILMDNNDPLLSISYIVRFFLKQYVLL